MTTLDPAFDIEWSWDDTPIDTTPLLKKEYAIEHCGEWRHYWNIKCQCLRSYQQFCKRAGCEICKERKRKQNIDRLDKLYGKAVATMSPVEFKEWKKDKGQDSYLRIPTEDGSIAVILKKRDDWNGEVEWLKDDLIEELSHNALPGSGSRISGKLDTASEVKPKPTNEPQMLIAYREFQVEWNDRLKDAVELEAIVLDRFDRQHGMSRSLDNLQWAIYELEQLTEKVVKEKGCEEFHFLQRTLTNIRYSEVEWNLWPNDTG